MPPQPPNRNADPETLKILTANTHTHHTALRRRGYQKLQPWQDATLMMAEDGPLRKLQRALKAKAQAA